MAPVYVGVEERVSNPSYNLNGGAVILGVCVMAVIFIACASTPVPDEAYAVEACMTIITNIDNMP